MGIVKQNQRVDRQLSIVPWLVATISLLAAVITLSAAALSQDGIPLGWMVGLGMLDLIAVAGLIILATERILRLGTERKKLNQTIDEVDNLSETVHRRLKAVLQINQQFIEATDEREIINLLLKYSVEIAGATGALFVPYDDYHQPLAAVSYGDKPFPIPDLWAEYLATPEVKTRCQSCQKGTPLDSSCPLLHGPFEEAKGLYCLPLRKGEREYGVLNLYMPEQDAPEGGTQDFLRAIADQSALALESYHLRKRELATLQQLQAVRQKTDIRGQLNGLLENLKQALDADYAVIGLNKPGSADRLEGISFGETLSTGVVDDNSLPLVEGILQGVSKSRKPVIISGGDGDTAGIKAGRSGSASISYVAAPILVEEGNAYGVVLAASHRSQNFKPRQLAVLQNYAGQIGVALQISHQMADLRYQTVIEERRRLAREIHDGLAQILGFLKLQMAQMQSHMEKGDSDRLRMMLQEGYQTVSEAYQEVRYAIDGLRMPADEDSSVWLKQILDEFRENMGKEGPEIKLTANSVEKDVPPEIRAEMIRILQEALSNIRKHAMATKVWVSYCQKEQEIVLEIQDNGRGFASEDVIGASRHGLRGMRERADLIGAEFQVISRPQEGTIIKVSVPLNQFQIVF